MTLLIFGFLAANSAPATTWIITQLANNSYNDRYPQIYKSSVVWERYGDSSPEIFLATIAGDFDLDGDVDGVDFGIGQTNYPTANSGTLATGDTDGDGDVDGVGQANYPTAAPASAPQPLPSPLHSP